MAQWPQPGQLQLWPRIQKPDDQTTMEFPGHWLSPDRAVMWHHTENRDQATTTVVDYPDKTTVNKFGYLEFLEPLNN
jgi:hypothetical protein